HRPAEDLPKHVEVGLAAEIRASDDLLDLRRGNKRFRVIPVEEWPESKLVPDAPHPLPVRNHSREFASQARGRVGTQRAHERDQDVSRVVRPRWGPGPNGLFCKLLEIVQRAAHDSRELPWCRNGRTVEAVWTTAHAENRGSTRPMGNLGSSMRRYGEHPA